MNSRLAQLPIYIINLSSAAARRQKMQERLAALGLTNYQFIAASDERAGFTQEDLEVLGQDNLSRFQTAKELATGAVGCVISHLRVYQKILRSEAAHALVLEDDAVFAADFMSVLEEALSLAPKWNLLQFGWLHYRRHLPFIGKSTFPLSLTARYRLGVKLSATDQQIYLGPPCSDVYNSHAYLINRAACRFALQQFPTTVQPLDVIFNKVGVPKRCLIFPPLAWQDGANPSGIDYLELHKGLEQLKATKQTSRIYGLLISLDKLISKNVLLNRIFSTCYVLFLTRQTHGYYRTKIKHWLLLGGRN